MRTNKWKISSLAAIAGLLVAAMANLGNADDASPAGIARVRDFNSKGAAKLTAASQRATQASFSKLSAGCAPKSGCAPAKSSCCPKKSAACRGCSQSNCDSCSGHCRVRTLYPKSPFLHHHQKGCCGKGCPPAKHYNLTYAANPDYFDQRDGKVFAAQGYGIPVAVPLAPNVGHTYNYGWGIPSSRLTPISRIQPRVRTMPCPVIVRPSCYPKCAKSSSCNKCAKSSRCTD